MKNKLLIPLNIQFFAEETKDGAGNPDNTGGGDNSDTTTNNNGCNEPTQEVNLEAFADIISEKDKQIQQLEKDVIELKKTNASLLVKVSAGATATTTKTFDENLLDLVGAKPRKE